MQVIITPLEARPTLEKGFVYGIKSLDLIKVGVAKNIEKRLETIRGHNPHGCELVFYRTTIAPYVFEKKMHELLSEKAVGREWFRVSLEEVRQASKLASAYAQKIWRDWQRWEREQVAYVNSVHSAKNVVVLRHVQSTVPDPH